MFFNERGRGLSTSRRGIAVQSTHALLLTTGFLFLTSRPGAAQEALVGELHAPVAPHVDQLELFSLVSGGDAATAFQIAFDVGSGLFEAEFNALDGGGANVGDGQRYTRVPRADLVGPGQWANHFPARATGPNAESCVACHNRPANDGGGLAVANAHRDPLHSGALGSMIARNTPHAFGSGALQRLAEEMTVELQGQRALAESRALALGRAVNVPLRSKGVDFGSLRASPTGGGSVALDTALVRGVSADLIVRPFQWKGSVATLRDFSRGAFHNEVGMQSVELVGAGVDGDGDGVTDELSVGDVTAMAIYLAAQPRPTSKPELAELGFVPALTGEELADLRAGRLAFKDAGCVACHVPMLKLDDPLYSEPSQSALFRDALLPAGQDPLAAGLDPAVAVSFDLTQDQPDNQVIGPGGRTVLLGALRKGADGKAVVELFGDLKRHDMGPGLAESIDEVGTGSSVFMTENLWGVGSTAPYLHDGRASTLTEAILAHGGEAQASRDAFVALPLARQKQLIAFLDSLVLFVNE